ncbi:MAG: bifunctional lysine ketoglutarate reductase /saccharopine dehydrogenase family protein, partial [Acidobacteriota bacterium]
LVHDQDRTVLVQPSARRVFHDKEFVRAGATMVADLSEASVIFGVKEIPPEKLQAKTAYMFFSHVIKGQPHNMPTLRRLMELECTLIDYEKVTDDQGRRLIFFGRFAGLAGMIDTLWALGQRFLSRGIETPLSRIQPAHAYDSLDDARKALREAGRLISDDGFPREILPVTIGVAGYGNVAKGAQEILAELPHRVVTPEELTQLAGSTTVSAHCIYTTTFKEQDLVQPTNPGTPFELQHYYEHPEAYRSRFEPLLPHLSVLVNANYWDERYPRLVTLDSLRNLYSGGADARLQVIGDLGCDIGGNIECTLKCTDPGDPVFTWNPATGDITSGLNGRGPVVLAVDFLPTELPREASEEFAATLNRFAAPIGVADYSVPFEDLNLPPEIKRAVIVHRGALTPDYRYLEEHVGV